MKKLVKQNNFLKATSILLIAAVLILSSTAIATDTQTLEQKETNPGIGSFDDTILVEEHFEEGIMPPTDWTVQDFHSSKNWEIVDVGSEPDFVHAGEYAAAVFYDYISGQNERLTSPEFDISSGSELVQLSFWVYSWTLMEGGTLRVLVNSGARQDVIWDMLEDEYWETKEYREVVLDITAYEGQTISLTWQYEGQLGPDVGLDDIIVVEGEIPPPPIFEVSHPKFAIGKVPVTITNIQTEEGGDATDVEWETVVTGNGVLKKFNETGNGTIPSLLIGSSETVEVPGLTGLGMIQISTTVTSPRLEEVLVHNASGFVFFFIVIING